jgi:hypothetical protein
VINPPPDLGALAAAFGFYSAIPPAAWASYDRQIAAWLDSVRAASDPKTCMATPDQSRSSARIDPRASALARRKDMDISEHISGGFLKVADLAGGVRRDVIAEVRPGKYQNPDCEFQSGAVLTLNATNLRALAAAWGTETNAWTGKEVELYVGKTQYNGQDRESVLARPISPPIPADQRAKPKPVGGPALDDEIPFAAAWV